MATRKEIEIGKISFHFGKFISLRERTKLKEYILKKIKIYNFDIDQLSVVFCSDQFLLKINTEFLDHNYFTDIITFDLSESDRLVNAELYISVDRVRENAKENNCSINEELHRVIFHGVLHLLGMNDKSTYQKLQMRDEENKWLADYF